MDYPRQERYIPKIPPLLIPPTCTHAHTCICLLEGSWMMAVPFTFRSSTPHVPGGREKQICHPPQGKRWGHIYRGTHPTPWSLPLRSRYTEAGCMQRLSQNTSTLHPRFQCFFILFLCQWTTRGVTVSENCDLRYPSASQIVRPPSSSFPHTCGSDILGPPAWLTLHVIDKGPHRQGPKRMCVPFPSSN